MIIDNIDTDSKSQVKFLHVPPILWLSLPMGATEFPIISPQVETEAPVPRNFGCVGWFLPSIHNHSHSPGHSWWKCGTDTLW